MTEPPKADPVGVVTGLRDYQLEGFRWLAFLHDAGLGGILADDMGLGKTLQALALITHARRDGAGPFLVVAPTSVVPGWVRGPRSTRRGSWSGRCPRAGAVAGPASPSWPRAPTSWSPPTRCCGSRPTTTSRCRGAGWCSTRPSR